MTLNKITTTATTSSKWISPPAVTEVTIPSNHRITRTTIIVSSIVFSILKWNSNGRSPHSRLAAHPKRQNQMQKADQLELLLKSFSWSAYSFSLTGTAKWWLPFICPPTSMHHTPF
jgi:hypothetical protein